jgi:hypothetical protein
MRITCMGVIKFIIMADWIRYFESEIPPTNLEETRKTLYQFTSSHVQNARNVVFITVRLTQYRRLLHFEVMYALHSMHTQNK